MQKNTNLEVIKTNQGSYIINLPRGSYLINGEPISSSGSWVQCDIEPENIQSVSNFNFIDYWINESGERMSAKEMQTKKLEVKNDQTYDKYEEEFNDIENEIAYLKLTKNWRPVYKTVREVVQDFDFTIYIEGPIIDPDILPLRYVEGEPKKNLCKMNAKVRTWTREIAKELGFVEMGEYEYSKNVRERKENPKLHYHFPSHGDETSLEFLKICKKYAYSSKEGQFKSFIGTFEECVERKENIQKQIRNKFLLQKQINDKEIDFSHVLSKVESIRNRVRKIDSKIKTQTEYRYAMNSLNELINELKKVD
jgi:hypothetical protein